MRGVCVVVGRGAGGGGGVPLAVVTGCGACAGRASPPRRLGLRSLGSSRPLPPLHAAATSPRPSSCLSIPGPVIPLSVGGPGRPGATWARRREEEVVPSHARLGAVAVLPPFPLPLPLLPHSSHPQLRGVPRGPRGLCVLVVGDGGCWGWTRGRVPSLPRGRGGPGWPVGCVWVVRVRLLPSSSVSGVRLSSPVPCGRGAGVGRGGCLEVASVPPPVPHSVSPPSSSRAACTASPSPQLLLPPLLQVPSAFRRGGLKTPGGVPPVRLGVGAAGLWGVGRVPSRPSSPLTPLLLPGRGGGARSRAAQPLAAAAVGKGAPDPAVVSCRERGARGGVASLSRAVSGGAGAPWAPVGSSACSRARPASKPTDPSQSLSLCPVYWPARGNPFSSVGRGWCCARLSLDGKEPKKTSYDS